MTKKGRSCIPIKCKASSGGLFAGEAGFVTLKALFWIIIVASAIYGAYKFAPPYFGYYMIKTDIEEEAKIAHMYSNEKLAGRIFTKANSWGVPLISENLVIERTGDAISIRANYSVTLDFFGKYHKVIDYSVSSEKPLKETSGILR